MEPGTVLDVPELGIRVEMRETAASTGGERASFDVIGRPRGFLTQAHVHVDHEERHTVIDGAMRLVVDGKEQLLRPGDTGVVPAGAKHRQDPAGEGNARIRIELRPAGDAERFMQRLADMSRSGGVTRSGYPRPVAAAELVRDFGETGHAAFPPLKVQQLLSRAILALASREYVFVDEWDVAAPPQAVFDALADANSYPVWWKPVYLAVQSSGEPGPGHESRQHFKGRLPYHLHTRSRTTIYEPPHRIGAEVDGDLRGTGLWTLTETAGGTHVRFDWQVHADRRLLRILTPVLRPALRANHAWAIARAMEGLEPYAQRRAAAVTTAAAGAVLT